MARIVNNRTAEAPKATAVVNTPEIMPEVVTEAPLPPDDDKVRNVCDESPQFPGGQKAMLDYLAKSIKYPVESIEKKEEGRATVSFTIEKDGSLSDIVVVRGVSPALDKEAIRIVKEMPKWIPGKSKGEVVRVKYTIPIVFKMQ